MIYELAKYPSVRYTFCQVGMRGKKKNRVNHWALLSFGCALVIGSFFVGKWWAEHQQIRSAIQTADKAQQEARKVPVLALAPTKIIPKKIDGAVATSTKAVLPKKYSAFNLDMPFISQAPEKNWDANHEDYCEEASLLMAQAFKTHTVLSVAEQETRLLEMHDWEMKTFGHFESTPVAEVLRIAKEFLKFKKASIVDSPTYEYIRSEVAAGHVVLVAADGRALLNPHFKNGGPAFHMVVVRGFTDEGDFITNDPGTQFGENFVYKKFILMSAMHDWDHEPTDKIPASGVARIIVLE